MTGQVLRLHFKTTSKETNQKQDFFIKLFNFSVIIMCYNNGFIQDRINTAINIKEYSHLRWCFQRGFPGGAVVKNPPDNAGDTRDPGSISGSGRSPGGGNGNPLHYSCLENLMRLRRIRQD